MLVLISLVSLFFDLCIRSRDDTLVRNPSIWFVGAEVYKKRDIDALLSGSWLELPDHTRATNPREFAEYVIKTSLLVDGHDSWPREQYYVQPRISSRITHAQINLALLACGAIGLLVWSTLVLRKKKA